MYSKPRKLAAEFWGTFVIVFASVAAVCANGAGASARQAALAPPGGSSFGTVTMSSLIVALAYGLAFAAMSATLGRASGGHFNPAVTVGFWAARRFDTFDALTYCLAQMGGAISAAFVLQYAIPDATWRAVSLGTPDLAGGLTRGPGMLIEGLGAFFVTAAIFLTNGGGKRPAGALSAMVGGVVVTAGSLLTFPSTGGSMNPARAFGPALVASHWSNHGVYWIGPLAGGTLAAWLCSLAFKVPQPAVQHATATR